MVDFPNHVPSYGSQTDTAATVLEAGFGDGYTQRMAEGINSVRDTWTLVWDNLSNEIINEIRDFLRAQKGVTAFNWTPPLETTSRKWTCKSWGVSPTGYNSSTLRAVFREEFDL